MKRKKMATTNSHIDFFDKRYKFNNNNWSLPMNVFSDDHWQIPALQAKREELNATKEMLNNYDLSAWSFHTKKRDPSTMIIKTIRKNFNPELLTQAWCKFYECLSKFDIISPKAIEKGTLNSMHLCEAPGGFISALNHYLNTKYINLKLHWYANTLNPSYEGNPTNQMIPDDRLIAHTKESWLFGADQTGDIMKFHNYIHITKEVLEKCPEKLDLITADGSIDCMSDPGNQELHVEHLHFCEVITALSLLKTGGNFVLKIFTTFEDSTICLLYLLNCVFTSVCIIKPITSKSGNSETYVVNQTFKGIDYLTTIWPHLLNHYKNPCKTKALFALSDIPDSFLNQITECADYFMRLQITTIHENINRFGQQSKQYNYKLFQYQTGIVNKFLTLHPIQSLDTEARIVPEHELKLMSLRNGCMKNSGLFKLYNNPKQTKINCNFVCGKKITTVFYSKFARVEDLRDNIKTNILNELSLFNQCKSHINKSCEVISCDSSSNLHQTYQNHMILRQILSLFKNNSNKNVLIINLSLITNFTVGLLFILSQAYDIYFFQHGLIYLKSKNDSIGYEHTKERLISINNAVVNITKREEFDNDVLEVVDQCVYDNIYFNCVHFYNSHL